METMIASVFSLFLLILGCSMFLQTRVWLQLATKLMNDEGLIMMLSLLLLPVGLVIIIGHNTWVWEWRVAVTLLGWGMTIKYVVYLLYPGMVRYFRPWLESMPVVPMRIIAVVYALAGAASSWQVLFKNAL